MSHDTCKNFHQDSWVAFKWNNFLHFVRYYLPSSQEKMKTMLTCIFFLFLVGGGCNQGVLWEMCKWRIANTNRMQFHWIFYLAVRKMEYNPPLKSRRSTKTDFRSNRSKFILHFYMILLPHWYRLGFWISCCGFQILYTLQLQYLKIIPRALIAS